jgi:hypothetical protein
VAEKFISTGLNSENNRGRIRLNQKEYIVELKIQVISNNLIEIQHLDEI